MQTDGRATTAGRYSALHSAAHSSEQAGKPQPASQPANGRTNERTNGAFAVGDSVSQHTAADDDDARSETVKFTRGGSVSIGVQ